MFFKLFKLSFFCLLFCFPVFCFAQEFIVYQKIKNISLQEKDYSSYTIGSPQEEFENIIIIHNLKNTSQSFTLNINLPNYLNIIEKSFKSFQNNQWKKNNNFSKKINFNLPAQKFISYKFKTKIKEKLPNENLVLTTWSKVENKQKQKKLTSSKIYLPHYNKNIPLEEKYLSLQENQQQYIQRLLEEESKIMEEKFFELLAKKQINRKNKPKKEKLSYNEINNINQKKVEIILLSIILIIILFLIFKKINNENKN